MRLAHGGPRRYSYSNRKPRVAHYSGILGKPRHHTKLLRASDWLCNDGNDAVGRRVTIGGQHQAPPEVLAQGDHLLRSLMQASSSSVEQGPGP